MDQYYGNSDNAESFIDPRQARHFCIKNNKKRIIWVAFSDDTKYQKRVLFWKIFDRVRTIGSIILTIVIAACLFMLFNQFGLRWITWMVLSICLLIIVNVIFDLIFLRKVLAFHAGVVRNVRNKNTKGIFGRVKNAISTFEIKGYLVLAGTDRLIHSYALATIMLCIIMLLLTIFYLSNEDLHFSFTHLSDVTKLTFLSIVNAFTADFSKTVGLSSSLSGNFGYWDQVIFSLTNTIIIYLIIEKFFPTIRSAWKGRHDISGNYSALYNFLEQYRYIDRFSIGQIVIFDYGPVGSHGKPTRWYPDDIKKLRDAEVEWVINNANKLATTTHH